MNLPVTLCVEAKLTALAAEDGKSPAELVGDLVKNEDRRRHVLVNTILYGPGEKRFRCFRERCKEALEAPDALREEEIGN